MHLLPLLFLLAGFTASAQSLSVMSYNLRYSTDADSLDAWNVRKAGVADLLDHYRPAAAGLQEALREQVQYLDEALPDYRYVGVGRTDGREAGEYAPILYDTTVLERINDETFWLSPSRDTGSVGWDAALERICTYGQFRERASGDTLHVFNAHFDHRGLEARTQSALLIAGELEARGLSDARVVVMGDFNSEPGSAAMQAFSKTLRDPLAEPDSLTLYGPAGTFQAFELDSVPDRRIDYILPLNVRVRSYRHVDDRRPNGRWPSDHLPVLAELD